ncbi:hypothetical protein ACFU6S_06435 [Streptomyces sp. NPDC057456]|uniref:hypothetical protein n=1 Tax=Streptomyces sp. NPDC057456 TaxID=3346139 RepID=UPI0036B5D8F9
MSYEGISRALAGGDPRELSDQVLAERFGCDEEMVARVRRETGAPTFSVGYRARREAFEVAYKAHVQDVEGGHRQWTGSVSKDGVPLVSSRFGQETAARVAFRIAHGRPPVGNVKGTCVRPHCVAPDHVADRRLRAELRRSAAAGAVAA